MLNVQTYVNDKEAAKIIGLATQTLRNYRQLGRGPAYHRIGASIRYKVEDLELYMNKHRVDPENR